MAKTQKVPAVPAAPVSLITIKDLEEEYSIEGRKIRIFIRSLGIKAPKIEGATGFGPRAKYEWPSNSPELMKIRKAIEDSLETTDED